MWQARPLSACTTHSTIGPKLIRTVSEGMFCPRACVRMHASNAWLAALVLTGTCSLDSTHETYRIVDNGIHVDVFAYHPVGPYSRVGCSRSAATLRAHSCKPETARLRSRADHA